MRQYKKSNKKRYDDSSWKPAGISMGDWIRLENILKESIIVLILLLLSIIVYTNIDSFNEIIILFLRLGSLILLVLFFFIIKHGYKIYTNIKYSIKLSSNKSKIILAILFLILIAYIYYDQERIVPPTLETIASINYSNFNPFYVPVSEGSTGEEVDYTYGDPTASKPDINISELEKQIHVLVNQEREASGLSPLEWDEELASIARAHSTDMSIFGYFDHINVYGEDPTARGLKVGYECRKDYGYYYSYGIAENIFLNYLYSGIWYTDDVIDWYDWNTQDDLARTTVDGWMDSPGHRSNILDPTYEREGIGVAISPTDYGVYVTQDFC